MLNKAKWIDNNWKFLSVASVDTDQSGSTVFVTKGDTNDAQLELTLASHCLCYSVFYTNDCRNKHENRHIIKSSGDTVKSFLYNNENEMAELLLIFSPSAYSIIFS